MREVCKRSRIAILYTHFPHYRSAVFDQLRHSSAFEFTFFYDVSGLDGTIVSAPKHPSDRHVDSMRVGPFVFQRGVLSLTLGFDAVVLLGNPYIVTNWLVAIRAIFTGQKILMWTHGWNRETGGFREAVRSLFYGRADVLLLYGERARAIGLRKGFLARKLRVIYNSLDYDAQKQVRDSCRDNVRLLRDLGPPKFLCVGRLVHSLQLEIAVSAISILRTKYGVDAGLTIVGDGPCRSDLAALARKMSVQVEFLGAIYDEKTLGPLFMGSVAVVSPGKVGLLAMHSLAYGTPVITHNDLDNQMPEVEAIVSGVTGFFFDRGDDHSLALAMERVISSERNRSFFDAAVAEIERNYTPQSQAKLIENAISEVLLQ